MGKSRTSGTRLSKDGNEIVIREIARVFAETGNRIRLGACGYAERLDAVMKAVMEKILRPARMATKQWRQLVWMRLRAFKNKGVLQFDDDNVARLSRRQMKRAQGEDARAWVQTRPAATREGRRAYTNRYRTAHAY